jgi:hypothetical protein
MFAAGLLFGEPMMQAAYAVTRLILFGFGWGIATGLALAAEALLPGVKWPIFGIVATLWTFVCALYVVGEARTRDPFEIRSAEFKNEPETL